MSYKKKRCGEFCYQGYQLPINQDDDFKCIPKYLEKMAGQFFAILSHHCKLFMMRIDLTAFDYVDHNKDMERFIKSLKQFIRRTYHLHRIGYYWVRETHKDKSVHWHLLLFLDGNKIQQPHVVNERVKLLWHYRDIGNCSYPARKSFHKVCRNDLDSIYEAFYHASYLTKERSKGYVGGLGRCQSSSNLKAKSM